jgi:hypothetical protein
VLREDYGRMGGGVYFGIRSGNAARRRLVDHLMVGEIMTLDITLSSDLISRDQTGGLKPPQPFLEDYGSHVFVGREDLADDPLGKLLKTSLVIGEVPEMDVEKPLISGDRAGLPMLGIFGLHSPDARH